MLPCIRNDNRLCLNFSWIAISVLARNLQTNLLKTLLRNPSLIIVQQFTPLFDESEGQINLTRQWPSRLVPATPQAQIASRPSDRSKQQMLDRIDQSIFHLSPNRDGLRK